MKVYKIPYDGKLSAYDVVKAVKKENDPARFTWAASQNHAE
jgi:hypothetical protein